MCAVSVSCTWWWRLKLASASRTGILPSPLRTAAARLPVHPSLLWRSSSLQTSSECPIHRDSPSRQNLETRLQSSAQVKVGNKVKLRYTMIVFTLCTDWLTPENKCSALRMRGNVAIRGWSADQRSCYLKGKRMWLQCEAASGRRASVHRQMIR